MNTAAALLSVSLSYTSSQVDTESSRAQGLAPGVKPEDVQAVLQSLAHCLFSPHTTDLTRSAADECLKVRIHVPRPALAVRDPPLVTLAEMIC